MNETAAICNDSRSLSLLSEIEQLEGRVRYHRPLQYLYLILLRTHQYARGNQYYHMLVRILQLFAYLGFHFGYENGKLASRVFPTDASIS